MGSSDEDCHSLHIYEKHERNKFRGERKGDSYGRRSEDKHRSKQDEKKKHLKRKHLYNDEEESRSKKHAKYDREAEKTTRSSRGVQASTRTPTRNSQRISPPPAQNKSRTEQWASKLYRGGEPPGLGPHSFQSQPGPEHRVATMYINPNFIHPGMGPGYFQHQQRPFLNPYGDRSMDRPMFPHSPEDGSPKEMLSFRSFLVRQDDLINETEAQAKYDDYRWEFKRTQIEEFFKEHKGEEWFQQRYHPEEMLKVLKEKEDAVKVRLNIFMDFERSGGIDGLTLDPKEQESLTTFLDKIVILLEGGTADDFGVLDGTKVVSPVKEKAPSTTSESRQKDAPSTSESRKKDAPTTTSESRKKDAPSTTSESRQKKAPSTTSESRQKDAPSTTSESRQKDVPSTTSESRKKDAPCTSESQQEVSPSPTSARLILMALATAKREKVLDAAGSDGEKGALEEGLTESDADDAASSSQEQELFGGVALDDVHLSAELLEEVQQDKSEMVDREAEKCKETKDVDEDDDASDVSQLYVDISKDPIVVEGSGNCRDAPKKSTSSVVKQKHSPITLHKKPSDNQDGTSKELVIVNTEVDKEQAVSVTTPVDKNRVMLHRLSSLFIRSLPPSVTKQEVEALCSKYPGFMRVGLADPTAERRWLRRGWVTFQNADNLREICLQMNMHKLRACSLGVIFNRSIAKRVRPASSLTRHDLVIKHDLRLAAQLVFSLDARYGLWPGGEPSDADVPLVLQMLKSRNPLMANLINVITDESSSEEAELLGASAPDAEDGQLACDDDSCNAAEAARFLDRLLLYLRVVHSVDYYNCCEYVNEHQMPHRCGIMHVRGEPAEKEQVTRLELVEYCNETEKKVAKTFLQPAETLREEEAVKLGLKDTVEEVDKYILANTTKVSENKYVCHVSCKKFHTPEFVRKHIISKHAERLDAVRKNAEFFNNYLRDVKRPKAMDPAAIAQREMTFRRDFSWTPNGRGIAPRMFRPAGMQPYSYYSPMHARGFRGGFNHRMRSAGGLCDLFGRPIVNYRDLDTPPNSQDMF